MAEFPALPLFTDAYIADTRHLSAAQHGAYILLLMMAWRLPECAVPDDDTKLSRWAAMDVRTWQKNKPVVMAFWYLEDGLWRQKRLSDERKYVEYVRSINSRAGKASALKRLNRGSTTVPTERQRNSNPHTHTLLKEEKNSLTAIPKEKRKGGTRLPEDFEPDASCHALARQLLLTIEQCQNEFDRFRDYYRAESGQKGVKLDWQATFRNWLRKAKDFKNGKAPGNHKPTRDDEWAKVDLVIAEARHRENGGSPPIREADVIELPGLRTRTR